MSRELAKESSLAPLALRLDPRAFVGFTLAIVAAFVTHRGWLGGPLGLTRPAEITLGIVAVAATLWLTEAVPLFVTSLVILTLELVWLSPALDPAHHGPTLFLNAFFSDVTLLFLGGFVLSVAIERTQLDRRISRALLRRAGTSPQRVLLAMMIATSVIGVWMSNTAACALMLGPAASMLARVPPGDGFRKALLLGIAFSANLGGLATPISSPPNAIVIRYLGAEAPSFAVWMALAVPLQVVLQLLLLVYLGRRYPSGVKAITLDDEAPRPFGRPQALVLGVFVLTVAGWIFGGALSITSGTVALLPVVVFFGTDLLRAPDLRALPWDVILLIGGGLALGAAVEQSGLAAWATQKLPTAGLPPFVVMGVVAVFAVVVSSVMSNTAAVNLLAPVVIGLEGVPSAPLLLVAAFACTLSMPLPVSTPPNAMAYGFSVDPSGRGEFTARDMIVPGTFLTIVGLGVLAAFTKLWFPRFLAF
ncbi:SLC13 family permease [Polyangium mundeleinium]|uniref:DASS family sodium-coupled anion symporter n=1 Tax=Polyangium mundeleinium TaxID=2995306 RepID=A0ABT5F6R7_9BACT|nr:DASS family sodium-coupled anion symporter [Polyangium mundeleinium]MDC0749073.1 DASS family sodium-coupled anion symporter [Polyangium mundeleinium]